jgi:hypothetical protein
VGREDWRLVGGARLERCDGRRYALWAGRKKQPAIARESIALRADYLEPGP